MLIRNLTKNTILATHCSKADRFLTRFVGLMEKEDLKAGEGLQIVPCNSIHMFFMKFPLDIIFLDKSLKVIDMIEDIKPWSISKIVRNAHSTLELPVGMIRKSYTKIGDQLEFL